MNVGAVVGRAVGDEVARWISKLPVPVNDVSVAPMTMKTCCPLVRKKSLIMELPKYSLHWNASFLKLQASTLATSQPV